MNSLAVRTAMNTELEFSLRAELRRKSLHLAMGIAPLGVLLWPEFWPLVIYAGTAVALVLDTLRLQVTAVGLAFERWLGHFAREHERRRLLGVTWFLVAGSLSLVLFEDRLAVASLLFVVVGDAAAAIVGKAIGKARWWGKSIEGAAACFGSCVIVGWMLVESRPALLVGAAVAAIVEMLPIPVDDNLRVPLASAAAMAAVYAWV